MNSSDIVSIRDNGTFDHTILCVDDDESFLLEMKERLSPYKVYTTTDIKSALEIIKREDVDMALLDINLGGEDGFEGLREIKKCNSLVDVVMVTGHREPSFVVRAIKGGALDYICKPIIKDELAACIERSMRSKPTKEKYDALLSELNKVDIRSRIIGKSERLMEMLKMAGKVKGFYSANILIEGESGTGKELLARYIHRQEEDTSRPFIVVNCAAIPENLVESEFFGHEKGAFTGAIKKKLGKFALADGGDLFLDEISCLRIDLQAKLLRAIQEKEFCPVGSELVQKSSFRLICATNDNLNSLVKEGKFRSDLYHRLKIISITMPSLKERIEDVPELVNHFMEKYSPRTKQKNITPKALELVKKYNWQGNIRELENVIHSAVILSDGDDIDKEIIEYLRSRTDLQIELTNVNICQKELMYLSLKDYLNEVEREYIKRNLEYSNGNRDNTAKVLNISRSTLYSKLKQFGLD